jgi:RNA polymerase sigma factor (sigma-70 family)
MKASAKQRPREGIEHAYERHRRPMLRAARAWFPALRGLEQDLYQGAWASLLRDSADRDEHDLEKRLAHAVYWQGLQELRTRRRRPTVSLDAARGANGSQEETVAAGLERADPGAVRPEEQAEIRALGDLAREVIADLTPRQQRIIKLQWGWGLPRAQVAALLGLSERQVKRELEEAAPIIARNVELVKAERWCEARRSLVLGYAFQLLSERRAAMAEQHLEHCPGCRELVRALSQRLDGLAAITPVGIAFEPPAERALPHLAAPFESARAGLADLVGATKQQAASLLTRSPAGDAGAVQLAAGGGFRGSGGMAATVIACVAIGGSATYCAVDGVPEPFRSPSKSAQRDDATRERDGSRVRAAREPAAAPTTAPVTTPVGSAPPRDESSNDDQAQQVKQPPPPPPDEAAPSPAPTGSAEFGSASAASPAASASPAPAPTSGGGEFGP